MQKMAARTLSESAWADHFPLVMNADAFGRRSDISLVLTPLRLRVQRFPDIGDTFALQQIDLEDAFGTVRFGMAWAALKHALRPRRPIPLHRLLA